MSCYNYTGSYVVLLLNSKDNKVLLHHVIYKLNIRIVQSNLSRGSKVWIIFLHLMMQRNKRGNNLISKNLSAHSRGLIRENLQSRVSYTRTLFVIKRSIHRRLDRAVTWNAPRQYFFHWPNEVLFARAFHRAFLKASTGRVLTSFLTDPLSP